MNYSKIKIMEGYRKTVYVDVMLGDKFVDQIQVANNPLFAVNGDEIAEKVYKRHPSLRGKRNLHFEFGDRLLN